MRDRENDLEQLYLIGSVCAGIFILLVGLLVYLACYKRRKDMLTAAGTDL